MLVAEHSLVQGCGHLCLHGKIKGRARDTVEQCTCFLWTQFGLDSRPRTGHVWMAREGVKTNNRIRMTGFSVRGFRGFLGVVLRLRLRLRLRLLTTILMTMMTTMMTTTMRNQENAREWVERGITVARIRGAGWERSRRVVSWMSVLIVCSVPTVLGIVQRAIRIRILTQIRSNLVESSTKP